MDPVNLLCEENAPIQRRLTQIARRALMQNDFVFRASVIRAIKSLSVFPNPLRTVEDALSLDGVGPKLASEILQSVHECSRPAEDYFVQPVLAQINDPVVNAKGPKKRARLAYYSPEVGKVAYIVPITN